MNRHLARALVAIAAITAIPMVPAVAQANASGIEASEQRVAVLRVEVREADGSTVRAPTRAVPWGEATAFHLQSADHDHALDLRFEGSGVAMTYSRDGAVVARQRGADRSRRAVIRNDDGSRIFVTVIPTIVSVESSPG